MSYRYNTIDIVVGVGLCAIVFGALLLFVAASGQFLIAAPQAAIMQEFSVSTDGMVWLQPAIGQAIVERAVLQYRTDRLTALAISEWDHAVSAQRSLQSLPGGPFGVIMQRAARAPDEHAARVQAVMGRSIVNFTRRGIRSGVLSADQYLSDYNNGMIGSTEVMARRLNHDFETGWQPTLGRQIIETSRDYASRTNAVQEQLGTAILHLTQARADLQDAWSANQYQLGSLIAAVDRTGSAQSGTAVLATSKDMTLEEPRVASTAAPVPDMPLGYLIVAVFGLCAVFFSGLVMSAAGREARALAEAHRNSTRWVYRLAA